jgi:hypothetical protein
MTIHILKMWRSALRLRPLPGSWPLAPGMGLECSRPTLLEQSQCSVDPRPTEPKNGSWMRPPVP